MTAALAASMVAFSAGPASAGFCGGAFDTAPDGRIRLGSGSFEGGGAVEPAHELGGGLLGPGQKKSFGVQFRNNESSAETIRLKQGTSTIDDDVRVKVFVDGVNKTDAFTSEIGLGIRDVAAGKRTPIVEVRFRNVGTDTPFSNLVVFGHYKGEIPSLCDALIPEVNGPT